MNFKITDMKNLEETKQMRDLVSRIFFTKAMYSFTVEENKAISKCTDILKAKIEALSK